MPYVAIYLDDVIIFSASMPQHLKHVHEVFKRLADANLRINAKKCAFGLSEIDFLGFKIKANCRMPSDEKTRVMRTFPTPTSKKEVQEFVGLTNYFRALIPDYAQVASPLYELMGKKAKFEWHEKHDRAFKELREKMSSEPVVRLPDLNKPFIVKTDACDTGMGAILLQENDGQRHVIEYASKRFNETDALSHHRERGHCDFICFEQVGALLARDQVQDRDRPQTARVASY